MHKHALRLSGRRTYVLQACAAVKRPQDLRAYNDNNNNNFKNSDNFAGSHATTLPALHMASMHSQMLMTTDSLWLTTGLT